MELLFSNPEFHSGINVTVRRGHKWNVGSAKDIDILDVNGVYENTCDIEETKLIRFKDIRLHILKYEHDSECRTLDGLHDVMLEVYPGFDEDEIVTVVYFMIK